MLGFPNYNEALPPFLNGHCHVKVFEIIPLNQRFGPNLGCQHFFKF
jgi:hypothetical protein